MAKTLTRKERNQYCRSCLQDAIRSINQADKYWRLTGVGFSLTNSLRDLKARVKAELSPQPKTQPL